MQCRRPVPLPFVSLLAVALTVLPTATQASQLRFSGTAKGGVTSTGNSLGLAKAVGENGPGTSDSIGTFLTLDDLLIDDFPDNGNNPWPAGTTGDWTLNGSSADLQLPQGSLGVEVLYAELVWGGSYEYGSENVSDALEVAVTLSAEGDMLEVFPDPQTAVTLAEVANGGFTVNYYMRSADVTDFVAEHLSTTYAVGGVPATQDFAINQLNAAGWTLVVAYRSPDAPTRNLTVFVGGQFVDEDETEDYPVSGFCTPPQGTVEGATIISAIEGDANRVGDVFQIAPSINGPFASLSGPNNPVDNFFGSQINGPDGTIDTLGTAGDANHDAFAGINLSGGRQGWDITKLSLSSAQNQLSPGQTSALLRAVTTGDSFMPVLAAFEIDVSSPDFESNSLAMAEPTDLTIGDQSTLSFDLLNEGDVDAANVVFSAPLEPGLSLVSFAVNGTPQAIDASDLDTGIDLGGVSAGASLEVSVVVEVSGPPAGGENWLVSGSWAYDYISCVGEQPLAETSYLFLNLGFVDDGSEGTGATGDGDGDTGEEAESGETNGDGGTDEGSGGTEDSDTGLGQETGLTGFGTDRGLDSGCNCRSTGSGGAVPVGASLGLLGLLGLLRRKRE